MRTWNTWSKSGHMTTWNILTTQEQVTPRNEHAEFKGILYGLPTRDNATTILRLKHNCTNIGIEPPTVPTRMNAASSSQTEPGCTPKAPPASCVPLDGRKNYIEQIMQAPEEADYDTDNVDKSPLMLPRSANKIWKSQALSIGTRERKNVASALNGR